MNDFYEVVIAHHPPSDLNGCFTLNAQGKKFRVCARCAGIAIGLYLSLLLLFGNLIITSSYFSMITMYLFPLPAIISWATQRFKILSTNNLTRFLTGGMLGIGVASIIHQVFTSPLLADAWVVSFSYTLFVAIIYFLSKDF